MTRGAGAFQLPTVKKLFQASYRRRDGTVDMEALRNKAMALIMIVFGGHPIDVYRMTEENVEDRPNHIDREGFRRPKMVFKGTHTKRPAWKVKNILGCGCEHHHEIENEYCLYNIVKHYCSEKNITGFV